MNSAIKLDGEMICFLLAVEKHGPTYRKGLPAATRIQDRARRKAKAQGLCKYHHNLGWSITKLGSDAVHTVTREEFP